MLPIVIEKELLSNNLRHFFIGNLLNIKKEFADYGSTFWKINETFGDKYVHTHTLN